MLEQNLNYAEIALTINRATDDEVGEVVNQTALHLNDVYRASGGGGLRMTNIEQDFLQSVEVRSSGNLHHVIIRVTARKTTDPPLLMCALQEYVHSAVFAKWLQEIKIE